MEVELCFKKIKLKLNFNFLIIFLSHSQYFLRCIIAHAMQGKIRLNINMTKIIKSLERVDYILDVA